MALVSMKKTDNDDGMAYAGGLSQDNYPYGLCIYLSEDQCDALGITKALRPGTQVGITATAIVVSATESLDNDNDSKTNDVSLSIQITDMSLKTTGSVSNAAAKLYGSAE